MNAVKMIFIYLQGTIDYGLWYPRGIDITHKYYTYANWVGSCS